MSRKSQKPSEVKLFFAFGHIYLLESYFYLVPFQYRADKYFIASRPAGFEVCMFIKSYFKAKCPTSDNVFLFISREGTLIKVVSSSIRDNYDSPEVSPKGKYRSRQDYILSDPMYYAQEPHRKHSFVRF